MWWCGCGTAKQYVVDIDPVARERVATARILADRAAFALYHGNRAMEALFHQDRGRAYAESVRALELGGGIDYLWVNLGAIYRGAGQDEAAEAMYRRALALSPNSPTAMNNLSVLYHKRGEWWRSRGAGRTRSASGATRIPSTTTISASRRSPTATWRRALTHYLDAIELKESEAEFYLGQPRVARLYLAMQRREESRSYAEQAVKHSRLVGERKEYQLFLQQFDRQGVVTASVNLQLSRSPSIDPRGIIELGLHRQEQHGYSDFLVTAFPPASSRSRLSCLLLPSHAPADGHDR